MTVTCLITLFCLVLVSCCEAFESIGNWADSNMLIWNCVSFIPHIWTHDAFYPHPHMRNLKVAAKRGKILVITLVVSAGLMVLVSTAILRTGKDKERSDTIRTVAPSELRARVIAAAAAGQRGLVQGRKQALNMALSAYASARRVEWKNEVLNFFPSVTFDIGGDRVTVIIPSDGAAVEVRAICGSMGASAIADAEDGSVRSSIYTSHTSEHLTERG